MRLFGVAMVRNEADIIEAFVRHNLSVLDGLAIADHDSIDATPAILAKIRGEGLPLRIEHQASRIYQQSATVTKLAREAFVRDGADFVFALDADEFLKVESRATLEAALALVPPRMHALAHLFTYVPDDFQTKDLTFGPSHLRRRVKREWLVYKCVVAPELLAQPEAFVYSGNHKVVLPGAVNAPHALLPPNVVYAHCPVRSREQLAAKAILTYLASLTSPGIGPRRARLWSDVYRELRAGAVLTEDRVRDIACNYGLPFKKWQPHAETELVEDPVRLVFEQRYRKEAVPTSLETLLRYAEAELAEDGSSMRQAPVPHAEDPAGGAAKNR